MYKTNVVEDALLQAYKGGEIGTLFHTGVQDSTDVIPIGGVVAELVKNFTTVVCQVKVKNEDGAHIATVEYDPFAVCKDTVDAEASYVPVTVTFGGTDFSLGTYKVIV